MSVNLNDLIWYLVGRIEKRQKITVHHVILTGQHKEFVLSRNEDISSLAPESGQITLSRKVESEYRKPLTVSYSDPDVQDELYVYTAEELEGEHVPNAMLNIEPYDEHLYSVIHQMDLVMRDNPLLFQNHTQILKEQFLSDVEDIYDQYVPETCNITFVGYLPVDGDNIPLGRLASGKVIAITSTDVPLEMDSDYVATLINGEYFIPKAT